MCLEALYAQIEPRFPLIAAVIEGRQDGAIYQNSPDQPTHGLVIHKFGFCQEFHLRFDQLFFSEISSLIKRRQYHKLRMYAPSPPMREFLSPLDFASEAERFQFGHARGDALADGTDPPDRLVVRNIQPEDLPGDEFGMDLICRFWRDTDDFVAHSLAVGAFFDGRWAGFCYAAGIGDGRAEVDIMVLEDYRGLGLGTALTHAFISRCRKSGLHPNWDCYANNAASVALAQKTGFVPERRYPFYNILGALPPA